MRRSMMRIANVIAKKQGCEALVTGESLAQVASQTVKALQCTDAAQDLPILRPLIGMDRTEIIETSRHINTFETSILPYEDCCTIFTPPHPKICLLYTSSCGSESNNLALLGAVQTRTFGKGIVVSGFEHPSVQRPLERLAAQGYHVTVVAPQPDGTLDMEIGRAHVLNSSHLKLSRMPSSA